MIDYKIMVVDDEEIILESIKDYFDDYNIRTYFNSLEAARDLERNYYDIIIGDYRMPDMSGLELFMKAKGYNAYNYGILLTAYADKDLLINFINENLIHEIIEKPLDLEYLKKAIDQGALSIARIKEKMMQN